SARALLTDRDRVTGVVTDEGKIAADEVVVAAGPWSPRLLEPLGIRLPVLGVRGWLVRVDPGRPLVRHLIWTAEGHGAVAAGRARPGGRDRSRERGRDQRRGHGRAGGFDRARGTAAVRPVALRPVPLRLNGSAGEPACLIEELECSIDG